MKLLCTSKSIFTINKSLKELEFNEPIDIHRSFIIYNLGKFEKEEDYDEIILEYKPSTIHKLKYLYHVKRIGGGLIFKHMCYVRLSLWQHIKVSLYNRILPSITKIDNLFKLLTIVLTIATILLTYCQIKTSNNIQKVKIINIK